ncbi:hypothetical protein QC762_504220 [Podospora pseudocomata]|uniref:Uncharacterized protein n=1 Tax=Podospora pseudocomata TaxID=2093779 RepID=A0ABR0GBK6_9PEZI|nr:hypothetical protein QC762_504220 [Podospora pseudocomata]
MIEKALDDFFSLNPSLSKSSDQTTLVLTPSRPIMCNTFEQSLQRLSNREAVLTAVRHWVQEAQKEQPGDDLEHLLWYAWEAVIDKAGKTPVDQQEQLVQFLAELRKHELPNLRFGEHKVWKDLPNFGLAAREKYNDVEAFAADSPEDRAKQDGLVGLLARLTGVVTKDIDPETTKGDIGGDFALFGLWTLREVFEGNVTTSNPESKEYITADGELVQGADAQVASRGVNQASLYILLAGEYLWRLSQANKDFVGNNGAPGPYFKDCAWKGFSKERWAIWKRGFEKAQEWVVGEEAKARVKAAVEKMAKLE